MAEDRKIVLPAKLGIQDAQRAASIVNKGDAPLQVYAHEGERVCIVAPGAKVEVILRRPEKAGEEQRWKARLIPAYRPRWRGRERGR